MADNEVVLTAKADLKKILDQLQEIVDKNKEIGDGFKKTGKGVKESLDGQTASVTTTFDKLRNVSRRVFDQLKQDFKSLASVKGLEAGLKLSSQFENTLSEVFDLNDAVRRLGGSFGVARNDFARFQGALAKGFGDIGASSEEAANALQGLTGTGVKGQSNVLSYGTTAAQLGMLSGERGQSGAIAGSLANVVRAQGKDVNDPAAMQAIAREVTAVAKTTGVGASKILSQMEDVFSAMPSELRKAMSPEAIGQIGVAATVAGPGGAAALKAFLGKSKEERAGLEAQGFGKIFGADGKLDLKGLSDVAKELKSRGTSSRLAAQSLGLEGEAADGLVRLIENSDRLSEALNQSSTASRDYAKEARASLGFAESFRANIRKVQGAIGEQIGDVTQGATDLLSKASESNLGAGLVTLGGGALAATLAGGGLSGIGKALGVGSLAKAEASERITGRKVQDVRVINFNEAGGIGGAAAGSAGGLGSILGGKLGQVAKVGGGALGAAGLGYEAGSLINDYLISKTEGKTSEGFEGNAVEQLFFKLDKLFGGETSSNFMKAQNVLVEIKTQQPELKASVKKGRGSAQ